MVRVSETQFFEQKGYMLSGKPYILNEGKEGYEKMRKDRFEEYKIGKSD